MGRGDVSTVPKVLHVVGVMDRWAVETWLVRMLEHARRRGVEVDWTFYTTFAMDGARDAEAEAPRSSACR